MRFSFGRLLFLFVLIILISCTEKDGSQHPLPVIRKVADKIIRETAFKTRPVVQKPVLGVQIIDFRHQFGISVGGIGYALSYLETNCNKEVILGLSSSGGIKIFLNGKVRFVNNKKRQIRLKEIAYNRILFQDTLKINLKKGFNSILIKSVSGDEGWKFCMRAVKTNGEEDEEVRFTLFPVLGENTSNWMIIGPFSGDLATKCPPEEGFREYYREGERWFTWFLPRRNILSELVISPDNSFRRDSYLEWHYANGETMLGMLAVADRTGEKKYSEFVENFCDFIIDHQDYFRWQYFNLYGFRGSYHRLFRRSMLDDTGAAALPFIELYLRNNNSRYLPLIESVGRYIIEEQQRLNDGVFCRPEPIPCTVWADDLFMSVPFLLRMAELTGDTTYYNESVKQIRLFYQYLMDEETYLVFHGWFDSRREHSVAHWGRANGWVIWAASEALEKLPENLSGYQGVLKSFRRHIISIIGYQDKNGLWHQVIDKPESYSETSCSAMFVLGIARAVRNGWIDLKYMENAMKGWEAICKKIGNDGTVHSICRGTGIGDDLSFYFRRKTFDHDPRGLGAVLTAGVEMDKLICGKWNNN